MEPDRSSASKLISTSRPSSRPFFKALLAVCLFVSGLSASSRAADVQADEQVSSPVSNFDRVFMNFYSFYYGPSLGKPRVAYQTDETGEVRYDLPVSLRNYFTLGYELSDLVTLSGTAYFSWSPVNADSLEMLDPYIRLSHNSLISSENFNLYADVRWHIPVTWASRQEDLLAGVQFFQVSTYDIANSRVTFGVYTSQRFNFFGPQGQGHDMELYFGPNVSYQLSESLAFTLLYEMAANHSLGDGSGIAGVSPDLEPGLSWDITPELNFSPYLNVYTSKGISLDSTSVGFTFGWIIK